MSRWSAARAETCRRAVGAAALLALAFGLTGCPAATSGPEGAEPPPTVSAVGTETLRLGLTEWSIETGGVKLQPGEVRVEVTNAGGTAHDVVIHGAEGVWASPELAPGQSHTMTITATAGEELELVCTLTGHHAQGMHTTILVVEET